MKIVSLLLSAMKSVPEILHLHIFAAANHGTGRVRHA